MIFGIGLGKTGTTSLAAALNLLEFKCLHDWVTIKRAMQFERQKDLALILDKIYPDSKFICTVRDLESWLDSRKRHIEFRVIRKLRGESNVPSRTEYDESRERRLYFKHHKRITKFFKNREKDVLFLNICGGDGWEKLCAFLEKPVPKMPFPLENNGVGRTSIEHILLLEL
jgi:hypothetical protein